MFWTRLIVSSVELVLSVLLAVFVVFWSYRSFARVTKAYSVDEELKKRNVAVAIVLTSLMIATSMLMHESVYPVTSIVTLYLTSRGDAAVGFWRILVYCAGHLVLGFLLSIGSVELALRLFEKLVSGTEGMDEDAELKKGNTAVAVVMAGVVLVTAFYLQQGISGLTKTLIPQPSLGQIRILR